MVSTQSIQRLLRGSHPDFYALEGLSYTIQELKRSPSEVICLGRGIDEAASSIGMPRKTFNRKLELVKLRLTQSYEEYDELLTEKSGNKILNSERC